MYESCLEHLRVPAPTPRMETRTMGTGLQWSCFLHRWIRFLVLVMHTVVCAVECSPVIQPPRGGTPRLGPSCTSLSRPQSTWIQVRPASPSIPSDPSSGGSGWVPIKHLGLFRGETGVGRPRTCRRCRLGHRRSTFHSPLGRKAQPWRARRCGNTTPNAC